MFVNKYFVELSKAEVYGQAPSYKILNTYIPGVLIVFYTHKNMEVSKNRATPTWMVYFMENPIKNWWLGGTTIFGNTHIELGFDAKKKTRNKEINKSHGPSAPLSDWFWAPPTCCSASAALGPQAANQPTRGKHRPYGGIVNHHDPLIRPE